MMVFGFGRGAFSFEDRSSSFEHRPFPSPLSAVLYPLVDPGVEGMELKDFSEPLSPNQLLPGAFVTELYPVLDHRSDPYPVLDRLSDPDPPLKERPRIDDGFRLGGGVFFFGASSLFFGASSFFFGASSFFFGASSFFFGASSFFFASSSLFAASSFFSSMNRYAYLNWLGADELGFGIGTGSPALPIFGWGYAVKLFFGCEGPEGGKM
jgi:hypothetical protein